MAYRSRYYTNRPKYESNVEVIHHDFLHQKLTVPDLVGGNPKYAYIKALLFIVLCPTYSEVSRCC